MDQNPANPQMPSTSVPESAGQSLPTQAPVMAQTMQPNQMPPAPQQMQPPPPPMQSQTMQPTPPPKKSMLPKLFWIIILVLLLATVAGGAFIAGQAVTGAGISFPFLAPTPTPEPTPIPTPSATPTPTPNPTLEWKTFQSGKFGYTFSYPPEWEFSPYDETKAVLGTHVLQNIAGAEVEKVMDHGIVNFEKLGKPLVKLQVSATTITYPIKTTVAGSLLTSANHEEYIENVILAQENQGKTGEDVFVLTPSSTVPVGSFKTHELKTSNQTQYVSIFLAEVNASTLLTIAVSAQNVGTAPFTQTDLGATVRTILSTFAFSAISQETTCQPGLSLFSGELFSICYPSDMTYTVSRYDSPFSPEVDSSVVSASFTNGKEKLSVASHFLGGWGGSPCMSTEKTKIDGYESNRILWKTEKANEQCANTYTNFVTLIDPQKQPPFPFLIDYRAAQDSPFRDNKTYLLIEQSMKIKQ